MKAQKQKPHRYEHAYTNTQSEVQLSMTACFTQNRRGLNMYPSLNYQKNKRREWEKDLDSIAAQSSSLHAGTLPPNVTNHFSHHGHGIVK